MRIVVLAFAASLPLSAFAAEITSDLTMACEDLGVHHRIRQTALRGDGDGVEGAIRLAIKTGLCRRMFSGQKVEVRKRADRYACVVPVGGKGACEWVEASEVKP